jgi:hypothetical protein
MQNIEKLGALGAMGVAGGKMAVWLGLALLTRPVSSGGVDSTTHFAIMASSFVVLGMISLAHVWFAQQLRGGADSIRG